MNENNIFSGSWLFAFLIIAMMFGGSNLFGNGYNRESVETQINAAVNNQSTQQGLRDILLSSANNNYETAQLISSQNLQMMQQNNTNLINAIQGFNQVNQTIVQQGQTIQDAIIRLGNQMESCCCAIKTQMLQDKYDELAEKYRTVQNEKSNAEQTQLILSTMGKWIANPAATTA